MLQESRISAIAIPAKGSGMAILASLEQQVDQVDVLQLETSIIDTDWLLQKISAINMFVSSKNSVSVILNGKVWGNVGGKCRP